MAFLKTPTENKIDSDLKSESKGVITPEKAPDYSVPTTKLEQFRTSKWRPISAFAGAVLFGSILIPLLIQNANPRATTAATSSWELALPASSTMLTELSAAPGEPIRGKISPVADITGTAPTGGAVARWVVQPGTSVKAGEPVVQISSGAASAAPLPGETRQIEAENQQTAAADDQLDLSKQLTTTQQKLAAAQDRVERAQDNISKARATIAGLRNGGAAPALPAPVPRRKRASSSNSSKSDAKVVAASGAVDDAQSAYNDTKSQLASARGDLSSGQKALAPLQSKVDDAQANVKTIEGKFDGSLASASDVQAARSARDNAKSTLKSASDRLESAQKAIPNLESKLGARESALEDAKRAQRGAIANSNTSAPADSSDAANDAPAPKSPVADGNSDDKMSVEQAGKMVDDALAESRAATKEADRLRAQIDSYQSKAQKSNQRIASATQSLENAQEHSQSQMVQSVPRVHFTAASAPASGVVVWIATLAREVGRGQSVFGMSSGKTYRARFEDRTNNWKNARVGQVVNALLAPPAAPVAPTVAPAIAPVAATKTPSTNDAGSPPMPILVSPASGAATPAVAAVAAATPTPQLDANNAAQQGATPVKVRLTRIAPPERAGDPAVLEGELVSQSNAAGPNYRLLASLPSVGAPNILAVPDSALVQRDGAWMVAVIEPNARPAAEVTPAAMQTPAPEATPEVTAEAPMGTLSWRKVEVGASDGIMRRVNSGLKQGERIVTDPLPLIAQAPPEAATMPKVKLATT